MALERPTDNLLIIQIFDHTQIAEALAGTDIGDIRTPDLISASCFEILIEQIRRDRKIMLRIRGLDLESAPE